MSRSRSEFYDMDGKPIPMMTWARMFEDTASRVVATWGPRNDQVGPVRDPYQPWISTVWLGSDHNFSEHGPPLIFETMQFGGAHNGECERWATRDAALAGHDQWVRRAQDETAAMHHAAATLIDLADKMFADADDEGQAG